MTQHELDRNAQIVVLFSYKPEVITDAIFELLLYGLPHHIQSHITMYRQPQDQFLSLQGKYLLKLGIEHLHLADDEFKTLTFNQYHKPLIGCGLHFNISHSERLVVCALSTHQDVGIDAELLHELPESLFYPILSREESATLNGIDCDRSKILFDCWTKKEAIVKGIGAGLHIDIEKINTLCQPVATQGSNWFTKECLIDAEYVVQLAFTDPNSQITILPVLF